jgi:hypothetical protein
MAANKFFFDAVHPVAEVFPMLSDDELRGLGEDIRKHGLQQPMLVWTDFAPEEDALGLPRLYLIDGRNRLAAMTRAGIAPEAVDFRLVTGDPFDIVLSMNVHRRHLTTAQKRTLIGEVLKARPERSNNATAKLAGVSDKTVAAVREELRARSEIPNVDKRTDTKGRKQSATKPKSDKPGDMPKPAPATAAPKTNREGDRHQAPATNTAMTKAEKNEFSSYRLSISVNNSKMERAYNDGTKSAEFLRVVADAYRDACNRLYAIASVPPAGRDLEHEALEQSLGAAFLGASPQKPRRRSTKKVTS